MKKKSLWLITGLMTIALLGVFVMQLYYIREAYRLKSQLFEQEVNQALSAVADKVQRINAVDRISKTDYAWRIKIENQRRDRTRRLMDLDQKYKEDERKRKYDQQKQMIDELNYQDGMIRKMYLSPTIISEADFFALANQATTPLNVDVNVGFDENLNMIGSNVRKVFRIGSGKTFNLEPKKLPDSIRYLVYSSNDGRPLRISLPSLNADMRAKFKIEDEIAARRRSNALSELQADTVRLNNGDFNVLEAAAREMRELDIPLDERVSKGKLDTLLRAELLNKNIQLNYDFWLKSETRDSVVFSKVSFIKGEILPDNTFKTKLFSNDVIRDPGVLYINFPDKESLILSNLKVTMASSGALLLVLLSIFSYTLYAILRQKKISEMKTDFINNMTHEFKTPVSTIMIASEALRDPEILEDKARIGRLAGIIYDENVRLGNHIERVLSIARLDKKELKLEEEEVDMNALIAAVTDSMSLQLQKKDAEVVLNLDALYPVVKGDELHLSNVLYNLIDNANKYSIDPPKITITTRNSGKNLVLEIEDEGIGMTKEQSKRAFDQFYRVPTGNLHDVKGFGLGLNYVLDIVTQMNGSIKVRSEKDKGTHFEIIIPLN
ncbi:two-component system, OmpR family, phosphate regulon sensor histidine kinase PhoR [Pedobacter westerhofensis]|uniref:histidine kinase n=1 Tax=Pedobacter westerhofensis TaxID=425512 RepID=A0A521EHL2_9SPHI|nr:HAMP domain-containing sensor histidine kinase [Pedobacter westerhofensis]SMO83385.1 two-component system, OmpR family, phosphate regulon sensor histidine kinase PhoR [Pedobacter westerhofensis]